MVSYSLKATESAKSSPCSRFRLILTFRSAAVGDTVPKAAFAAAAADADGLAERAAAANETADKFLRKIRREEEGDDDSEGMVEPDN
jgi:hypothetical protein